MKTIHVQQLTNDNFRLYGSFTNLLEPTHPFFKKGQPQFYSDLISAQLSENTVSLSVCLEEKREKNIIEFAEIHNHTEELMIPLSGDVIIYCAPPTETSDVPFDYLEAFYIPKGTAVKLHRGVWHGCQFPVTDQYVQILCLLPERTYANDCFCYFFKEEEQILVQDF